MVQRTHELITEKRKENLLTQPIEQIPTSKRRRHTFPWFGVGVELRFFPNKYL